MKRNLLICCLLALAMAAYAQNEHQCCQNHEGHDGCMNNPVIQNIMARRSIRKYKDTPVEHEKLEIIAKCGINAPNGMNSQKWAVRVVEDYEFITALTEIFKKENAEMVNRDPDFKNMFRNAPNIICVATERGGSQLDAGMLGENMMLAAQSLGLGTCCLGGPVRFLNNSEEAKRHLERLNLPDNYELVFILAVGYPDESPEPRPREEGKIQFIR